MNFSLKTEVSSLELKRGLKPGRGVYLVERWVRGCAAQMGAFLASQAFQWPLFYLKIGLDIGQIFAKCKIFNEFFLWFTYRLYRLSKSTYVSLFT